MTLIIATIAALALLAAVNCVLYEKTCQVPGLRELMREVLAALIGLYAGSRSQRP